MQGVRQAERELSAEVVTRDLAEPAICALHEVWTVADPHA